MTYLNDGTLTVSLEIDYRSQNPAVLEVQRDRTIGGKDSYYAYAYVRGFNLITRWVSNSDSQLMNQWWMNSTPLTLYYGPEASSYDVILTSKEQPFNSLQKAYNDSFYGTVILTVK